MADTTLPPNIPDTILDYLGKMQESLSVKATDILLDDDTISLTANGVPIGNPIKITDIVDKLENDLKDYEALINKPLINGVELKGEKSLEELGFEEITNSEIEEMIQNLGGL